MEVCHQGNEAIMTMLLTYGADPNRIDHNKNTALDICTNTKMRQLLLSAGARTSGEHEFVYEQELHPKINKADVFKSGFLLPQQALVALNSYTGRAKKLKKYSKEIPSLFRTIVIGISPYILYDSHEFHTTCKGCLHGRSPYNPLGKGGEAKIVVAQSTITGQFFAARIADHVGECELGALQLLHCFVDHLHIGNKHYIIQKLHKGICLSELQTDDKTTIIHIMKSLLGQIRALHEKGYILRDIADNNVMIDPNTMEVYLIDFGHAIKKSSLVNGCAHNQISKLGTQLAPELEKEHFFGYSYSEQSDLFALGNIFSRLLSNVSFSSSADQGLEKIVKELHAKDPRNRKTAKYYLDLLENLPKYAIIDLRSFNSESFDVENRARNLRERALEILGKRLGIK
jgi:hypothetical protein